MDFFGWIPLAVNKLCPWLMDLWEAWSIQLLVLACLVFQFILLIFGSCRRFRSGAVIRFIGWASYLLSGYVATLALGKLTVFRINDPTKPNYDTELKALLAPLLLLLLGNPDTITAYSVEDNRLGVRQVLNLVFTVGFVIWILIRCWDTSKVAALYFPMLVAGIIKYGETVWALKSAYRENASITVQEIIGEESIPRMFRGLPENIEHLDIILKAYYRFDCLKPHLVSWLYNPLFVPQEWMSLDENPQITFLTSDIELGFMFDVLYTKSPVLYTRCGIVLRFISYFSLLSTLSGFSGIFKNSFLLDLYVSYTYAVLIGVGIMETYQILQLPFSDWAIIKMIECHRVSLVSIVLPFIVKRSLRKKRWSQQMGQLNLLDCCLNEKWPKAVEILKFFNKEKKFKINLESKYRRIPMYLKKILLRDMKRLDQKRGLSPFSKRGEWTLTLEDLEQSPDPQELKWSVEMLFDKSIIIWHIATDICYNTEHEDAEDCWTSKLLSDYMMFLLAQRPYILSLTTADITLQYAYCKLKGFLEDRKLYDRESSMKVLSESSLCGHEENVYATNCPGETLITKGWDVLGEAEKLAHELRQRRDKWRVMSCVWVEMICYAAHNCQVNQHARLLRQGGDLITHVWLLIAHKTDKFNTSIKSRPRQNIT